MTQTLTLSAERDDHTARIVLPVREYYGSGGAWVRCATCDGVHYATTGQT